MIIDVLLIIAGIIVGFIFGVSSIYILYRVGNLLVTDDEEDTYMFLELEDNQSIVLNKKFVVLDVKKRSPRKNTTL